jgi:hypothetical protein
LKAEKAEESIRKDPITGFEAQGGEPDVEQQSFSLYCHLFYPAPQSQCIPVIDF